MFPSTCVPVVRSPSPSVSPSRLQPRGLPTLSRVLRGLVAGILIAAAGLGLILFAEHYFGLAEAHGAPSIAASIEQPRPGGSSTVNGRTYEGEELACDFPPSQWMQNKGGRDGAGMCVLTSIELSAIWAGLEEMRGIRDWAAAKYTGGGWPDRVDQQIAEYCREKGITPPTYIQYQGPNPETIIDICSKTGRIAACTYGWSPRYGQTIAHMVCCPHLSDRFGVCLDNNAIGGVDREHLFEWMSRDELLRRIKHPGGKGWVFAWVAPGAPPTPTSSVNRAPADVCQVMGPYRTMLIARRRAEEMRLDGWRCGAPYRHGFNWYFRACKP